MHSVKITATRMVLAIYGPNVNASRAGREASVINESVRAARYPMISPLTQTSPTEMVSAVVMGNATAVLETASVITVIMDPIAANLNA